MNAQETMGMTAIDILQRSIDMHPSCLIERLQTRAYEDSRYAATRENPAIKKSVLASFEATMRAIRYIESGHAAPFIDDMGAGIIALSEACKLQCLPHYKRTETAVALWG